MSWNDYLFGPGHVAWHKGSPGKLPVTELMVCIIAKFLWAKFITLCAPSKECFLLIFMKSWILWMSHSLRPGNRLREQQKSYLGGTKAIHGRRTLESLCEHACSHLLCVLTRSGAAGSHVVTTWGSFLSHFSKWLHHFAFPPAVAKGARIPKNNLTLIK